MEYRLCEERRSGRPPPGSANQLRKPRCVAEQGLRHAVPPRSPDPAMTEMRLSPQKRHRTASPADTTLDNERRSFQVSQGLERCQRFFRAPPEVPPMSTKRARAVRLRSAREF